MTMHDRDERKALDALAQLPSLIQDQNEILRKLASTTSSLADMPLRQRQVAALEKIADALTDGHLSGIANLLEQIDVTLSHMGE